MRSKKFPIYTLLFMVLLTACASTQSPQDMSPEDVAIWANRVYVSSYDGYLQDLQRPMTPARIEALQKKRMILSELYPYLMTMNTYIESGVVPEQAITDIVINLVYQLTDGM